MYQPSKLITVASLCILLSACGGGSDNTTGSTANSGGTSGVKEGAANTSPGTSTGPSSNNSGSSGASGGTTGATNPDTPVSKVPSGNTGSDIPPSGNTDSSTPPSTGTGSGAGTNTGTTISSFAYDTTARFNTPGDINIDGAGNLYVMDRGTQQIRRIAITGEVTTLSGTYRANTDIAVDTTGNVFILSYNPELDEQSRDGDELHKLAPDGTRTLVKRYRHSPGSYNPLTVATGGQNSLYVLSRYRTLYTIERIDPDNSSRQVYSLGTFGSINAMTVDAQGNIYLITTGPDNSRSVLKIQPDGTQSVVAPFNETSPVSGGLTSIANISVDAQGNIYVAHYHNHPGPDAYETGMAIHKITPSGTVTAIRTGPPGSSGQASETEYDRAYGRSYVVAGSNGNLYASYEDNHTVYRISQTGEATLIAGTAGQAGSSD